MNNLRQFFFLMILLPMLGSGLFAGGQEEEPRDWTQASWDEILQEAKGSQVNFYMWGGSASINSWIDTVVAPAVAEQYGIRLRRVPMDASVFINQLLDEKTAGKRNGSIDLMWINGENFRRAKAEGLLYGSFAQHLPNFSLVDPESVAYDFGTEVDGWEVPYGRAQFVFEYDSAQLSNPPGSYDELLQWAKDNPGRFSYPQPPDFTGSAFLRQLLYATSGGVERFTGSFDRAQFEEDSEPLWQFLNEIKPYLWQQGETYPRDKAQMDVLFEQGELAFNMTYTQAEASGRIAQGRYPDTVRTLVFDQGSISNIHFNSIPWNAPNPAGAMVLANYLLSPEAQYSKNIPEHWGDFTVLDMSALSEQWRQRFAELDLGAATLPLETLGEAALPEISPDYVEAIEDLWVREVLAQ